MIVVEINSTNVGSTGNIAVQIANKIRQSGNIAVVCYPKSRTNMKKLIDGSVLIGDRLANNIHLLLGSVTGYLDCFSLISTARFLRSIDKINPDIIHIHNLHNCYINVPLLFRFIKKRNIPTVWTLHDCWSFTGRCPHFQISACEKWKNGCFECIYPKRAYPRVLFGKEKWMWRHKKKWFTNVENLTIVTPSRWLASMVSQSFLCCYPIQVINNGIDLDVFKPTQNAFRNKYDLLEKKIVLGVSSNWNYSKGLDTFIWLSQQLPEDYQIVLVGTDDSVDNIIPDRILSIHRTSNQLELANIYSASDVFVNPTREDTFPTVNLEAIACGTPVITFDTGGSAECINKDYGIVVAKDDKQHLLESIEYLCTNKIVVEHSNDDLKRFDCREAFQKYVDLYEEIISKR